MTYKPDPKLWLSLPEGGPDSVYSKIKKAIRQLSDGLSAVNGSTSDSGYVASVVAGSGIGVSITGGVATISNTRPLGVTSFNGQTGAVTLISGDVTTALGYTPVNKSGDTGIGPLGMSALTVTQVAAPAYPNGLISLIGVAALGGNVLTVRRDTDTAARFRIDNGGGLAWGNGTGAFDVGLSRTGPAALSLSASLTLTTGGINAANFNGYIPEDAANKGVANGYASLDSGGHVPMSQIPSLSYPVTSVNGATGDVVLTASDVGATTAADVALAYAPLTSPSLTGTPTAPTASGGTNTAQIATTAFVQAAVSSVSSPVTSVNSKTGAVTLVASDVGAPSTNGTGATGNWAIDISGNAATATTASSVSNGVYTTGSYADPPWITSLAKSKVGLGSVENTALSTWAGSTNLTTLGTIGTGVWHGTAIGTAYGGTGRTDGLSLGLTGTPNISVGTISAGAITASGAMTLPYVGAGLNALRIGAAADLGTNNYEASIALPSGAGHWPFGITKAGVAIFTIDNGGAITSASTISGTTFSATVGIRFPNVGAGNNGLLSGALSDMGASNYEVAIALPAGSGHWPFGIAKGGTQVFTISDVGAVACGALTSSGSVRGTSFNVSGTSGLASQVVALAKLTPGGADGSITISGGIVTAYTAPT